MKKFKLIIIAVAAISVIWASCTKNEEQTEVLSAKEQQPVEEVISYTIPKGDLIIELQALMDEREKSSYNNVKISFDASLSVYQIIIDVVDDLPPLEIVCQGSGYSFANCVKDYFALNPDGCLVITYDNDIYSADDNCL
jgi:hypothetical protein